MFLLFFLLLVFQENSVELFGEMFQNLPRLHSGFLSTSRQTSRNILNLKQCSKDITSPSLSSKPQSDITPSTPLSPGSLCRSPQSLVLSSAPSSPHSQSSRTKSKPKELPSSSLLLPTPVRKRNITVSPRKSATNTRKQVQVNQVLLSSPQRAKDSRNPFKLPGSNKHVREEDRPASLQTGILNL